MDIDTQLRLLGRGVAEVLPAGGLREKLETAAREQRPLRVKLGLDPTAPDIHLGFAVVLRKMRQFQDLGHQVVIIIGDRTASIGDPSGRSATRKMLSMDEIQENAATYKDQLCQILDRDRTEIRFNSEWLDPLGLGDIIGLASKITVARLLERDDFRKRLEQQDPISLHELLYPLCQAYDSVAIEADIEMGGTDQVFNILMGRELQRELGQEPQVSITMPILVGLDGVKKMSKSLGNYVGITEPAVEMFGKIMSIPDRLMRDYFILTTEIPEQEVDDILAGHPMEAKRRLARAIVTMHHSAEAAQAAAEEFNRVFSQRELPSEMDEVRLTSSDLDDGQIWIIKLLRSSRFATTNSEARRLVQSGAVTLDDVKVTDPEIDVEARDGAVLRVGKRRFGRIVVNGGE